MAEGHLAGVGGGDVPRRYITKTRPCNKQRFFGALKIENFIRKNLIFFLYSARRF